MLGEGNCIASSTYTAYTLYKVPTAILERTKANLRSKGKNERLIAFLPTPTLSLGAGR